MEKQEQGNVQSSLWVFYPDKDGFYTFMWKNKSKERFNHLSCGSSTLTRMVSTHSLGKPRIRKRLTISVGFLLLQGWFIHIYTEKQEQGNVRPSLWVFYPDKDGFYTFTWKTKSKETFDHLCAIKKFCLALSVSRISD